MDNGALEELLSSFASDTFAIQSQPEKDLRASLINFFAISNGPNGVHDPNNNLNSSAVRQQAHPTVSTRTTPPDAHISLSFQANEPPPHNTPLGSPMEEGFFQLSIAENNASGSLGNYPAALSPTSNNPQPAPMNHDPTTTSDSFGNCLSCLYSIAFHPNAIPHHAPNCQFNQFNNNSQSHHTYSSNLSAAHPFSQPQDGSQSTAF
ncbi:hypothetical protein PCANC_11077 [Puccinia coronata f. sp. avenae]|uniref:Uncharacterized protein n=1 Tax=Puccinia coronata f. sp. avenae TaxID=200324 RepID=A0A2N5U5Z1_9BASI|nr:hypothetical protein PCASD_25714 [Puccinia coronata f. sp. avenae]PLW13320.1 hypothetical protein PCANC_16684 [Puccinia coronata f. sp. avenae]PLW33173.1 hypothetical protein PCASD_13141 [Puccinia coronata f. sp. avenae]PLW41973.1 hypothetical protein PCANC_11077 [Puccinia coronata f. sp. avenae]